jgi:hypothetical protein
MLERAERAARAKNPWMKRAFEEAAAGWLVLAESGLTGKGRASPMSGVILSPGRPRAFAALTGPDTDRPGSYFLVYRHALKRNFN